MKYEHDPRLPWRNPENVPLDKIPEGWRLMLPGEVGAPTNLCKLWMSAKQGFKGERESSYFNSEWTYIIPDTVPLPEEFRGEPNEPIAGMPGWYRTPEKPAINVTVDNSGKIELRDWFAGMALTSRGLYGANVRENEVAEECYRIADAMLKAREVKP